MNVVGITNLNSFLFVSKMVYFHDILMNLQSGFVGLRHTAVTTYFGDVNSDSTPLVLLYWITLALVNSD